LTQGLVERFAPSPVSDVTLDATRELDPEEQGSLLLYYSQA